jgi:hypothetical protein
MWHVLPCLAELKEKHSEDRTTNMKLREQLLATQARLSDVLMPHG